MAKYHLPNFGEIDMDNLDETYEAAIEFSGKQVEIELIFEGESITAKKMKKVEAVLSALPEFDEKCKNYINRDYKDTEGETVKLYIEHHLQELDKTALAQLTDAGDNTSDRAQQMLAKLHLVGVIIYPDGEDQFATFEYSIGTDITNYLIVIETDAKGRLDYMTMES
jgi:hypothetical protein